jgi:Uma2 family endonuclease
MTRIITASVPEVSIPSSPEPWPRRWAREEYYRLGELEFFHGQRVELIEGEIIVLHPPTGGPMPRRWTREEYYRLGEQGLFHGQRVELIEGEIMVHSPQNWPHTVTVDRVSEALRRTLGNGFWVRTQFPLNLGTSDPEPDVSVVLGRREDYSDHPTTAVLIVEVSESTLDYDRSRKASLYACAGIADYWMVNLVNNQLEVRRDPRPDPSQHYGHGYASLTTLVPAAIVNPLAAPQVSLAVADLLP